MYILGRAEAATNDWDFLRPPHLMIQFSFISSSASHELCTMNFHMSCGVLDMTEKNLLCISVISKKRKKEGAHFVLCSESNSENFIWKNCDLWQSTVTETWYIRWPFYNMATVLLFQGNSGYDLARLLRCWKMTQQKLAKAKQPKLKPSLPQEL